MGWLKLTQAEQRVILREAERAKNLNFSMLELRFTNSFLSAANFSFSADKDALQRELKGDIKFPLQTPTGSG